MWSVTAIAPSPWSRAVASSTSTGVAQSGEWSVCMCRSTSILVRAATLRRTGPSGGGWWRRAASAAYTDSSSSARRSKPRPSRMSSPAARQRGAQRRVADEARELGGEDVDVARLEEQAALALADELLVDRQPRRDAGRRRRRSRRAGHAGAGAAPSEAAMTTSAELSTPASPAPPRPSDADARPHVRAQRRDGRGAAVGQERDPPRQRRVEAAQRAQREAQRTALLLVGHDDVHALVLGVGARPDLDAGAHDAVLGGEGLREELRRGLVAGQAGVEAAEDELDDAARELRGDDPLGRRDVERADVQRARVAQRGARASTGRTARARGRRRAATTSCIDSMVRATSTGSDGAPPRRGDLGQHLADGQHPRRARPARAGATADRIAAPGASCGRPRALARGRR